MGLERTLAVINGKKTVYHTDLFENTIEHIKRIVGESHFNERGARIIADPVSYTHLTLPTILRV